MSFLILQVEEEKVPSSQLTDKHLEKYFSLHTKCVKSRGNKLEADRAAALQPEDIFRELLRFSYGIFGYNSLHGIKAEQLLTLEEIEVAVKEAVADSVDQEAFKLIELCYDYNGILARRHQRVALNPMVEPVYRYLLSLEELWSMPVEDRPRGEEHTRLKLFIVNLGRLIGCNMR